MCVDILKICPKDFPKRSVSPLILQQYIEKPDWLFARLP